MHAYEQWGDGCFERLRGMFGIAIWDRRRQTLLLARDRAGIKPLHYAERRRPSVLRLGAEVAARRRRGRRDTRRRVTRSLPLVPLHAARPVDLQGRVEAAAGTPAAVDERPGGGAPLLAGRRRRDVPRDGAPRRSRSCGACSTEAVRLHMVSDVPLGAFLSGGVDSSAVVGLMAGASDRPVKTFSIGFDEPAYDELEHARTVAAHFGTEHHEFVVRPDGLGILDQMIEHFDEPFADSSAIPTWYVSEMARRHVTVVLSGDGGDELFGGYDRYLPHPRVARFDRLPLPGRRQLAGRRSPPAPARGAGQELPAACRARYRRTLSRFDPRSSATTRSARCTRAAFRASLGGAEATWPARGTSRGSPGCRPHSRMMRVRLRNVSAGRRADEGRSHEHGALDRVARAAARQRRHRLRGDAAGALQDPRRTPQARAEGSRQAAAARPASWTAGSRGSACRSTSGSADGSTELFGDVLGSARTRQRGYFEPAFVSRIVQEHLSGRRDHTLRLWQLLVFELWHRRYVDAPSSAAVRSTRLSS